MGNNINLFVTGVLLLGVAVPESVIYFTLGFASSLFLMWGVKQLLKKQNDKSDNNNNEKLFGGHPRHRKK